MSGINLGECDGNRYSSALCGRVSTDEQNGNVFVLMHGQRTKAYLYRNFIPALTKLSRVIVPHHMGFGKSETPQDKAYSIREREHTDIWRSYKLFLPCASSVKKTARLRQISVCRLPK